MLDSLTSNNSLNFSYDLQTCSMYISESFNVIYTAEPVSYYM